MKYFKNIVSVVILCVVGICNAKQMESKTVPQSSTQEWLFGEQSNEDLWKIIEGNFDEQLNAPEKRMPKAKAMAIINAMNSISDAFNKDYTFTEFNPLSIGSNLTLFLENIKNKPLLHKLLQTIKDNAAELPAEKFSNITTSLEQSINNKNAAQFYAIYSALEHYFRGTDIKPLVRVGQSGWLTSIKNAIMNRVRNAYHYVFGKGSEDQAFGATKSEYVMKYEDPTTKKTVTKVIKETKDATGRVISYEEIIKK
jgi:hypothetical protein